MTKCVVEGCERKPAYPDQSRCEDHRLRWTQPPVEPLWVRRMREGKLPAKELAA